ncbi:MAG: hypothetical protein KDC84_14885 [Crocinitomicaceae bacterium]|nr:hypothetical protein [Crocinitomicaceae bacterium]
MKILVNIVFFGLAVGLFAQDTIRVGKEYKSVKRTAFEGFIGMDSTGFYSLDYEFVSKKKSGLYLNKYDRNSMDLIFTKDISPLPKGEHYIEPVEIFNLNKKVFLAAIYVMPEEDLRRIAIYPISRDGVVDQPVMLDTIFSSQEKVNDFRIIVSEEHQNFVLITRRPFFKNKVTGYNLRKYDGGFNLIWEDVVNFPYEAKNFEFKDISFDGLEKVMVLSKRMDVTGMVSNKMKKIENNKYNLWVYRHDTKKLNEFEISLQEKWIIDIRIIYKNDKIFVTGYYSEKRGVLLKGFFAITFDENLNMLNALVKSLSEEDVKKFIKPDQVDERTHLEDFYLREAFVLENEEIVLIGEKYYKEIDTYFDPRTNISSYTDIYNYNSVLVSKINPEKREILNVKIPKYQSTVNDNGYYSSIAYGVVKNDVWVFFNDTEKNIDLGNDLNANYKTLFNNRRVIPMYVKIDPENRVLRKPMNIPDDGFLLVPRYSDQLEDDHFYFIRERGRSANVVRFKPF